MTMFGVWKPHLSSVDAITLSKCSNNINIIKIYIITLILYKTFLSTRQLGRPVNDPQIFYIFNFLFSLTVFFKYCHCQIQLVALSLFSQTNFENSIKALVEGWSTNNILYLVPQTPFAENYYNSGRGMK